jgi:transcriptional regulator with XRE-family HTH domain
MNTPERILLYRKQKNLSQSQMAKAIGNSQAAYAKIESGVTKNITLDVATKIAKALGEDFNEVFEIEKDNKTIVGLKAEIVELKSRISEKDLLIKSISSQHKYTKDVLIAEVYLFHYNQLAKLREQLENCSNENVRSALTEEISRVQKMEKRKFKIYTTTGVLEQSDIDDVYSRMSENFEGYLNDLKRFA